MKKLPLNFKDCEKFISKLENLHHENPPMAFTYLMSVTLRYVHKFIPTNNHEDFIEIIFKTSEMLKNSTVIFEKDEKS